MRLLAAAQNLVLDLVFPVRCLGCDIPGEWFCTACHVTSELAELPTTCAFCRRITRRPGTLCPSDAKRTGLRGVVAYGDYHAKPLARAISAIKYDGLFAGIQPLAHRASSRWAVLEVEAWQAIVPVPLAPRRWRDRGFNQAELIARALGTQLARPVAPYLRRTRETPQQVGLGRHDRAANVAQAFAWHGPSLRGPVLLVDDVMTTGVTLAEAGRALRAAGASPVWATCLAVERRVAGG